MGQGLVDYGVDAREHSWSMTMRMNVCIGSRYRTLCEEGRRVGE